MHDKFYYKQLGAVTSFLHTPLFFSSHWIENQMENHGPAVQVLLQTARCCDMISAHTSSSSFLFTSHWIEKLNGESRARIKRVSHGEDICVYAYISSAQCVHPQRNSHVEKRSEIFLLRNGSSMDYLNTKWNA